MEIIKKVSGMAFLAAVETVPMPSKNENSLINLRTDNVNTHKFRIFDDNIP